MFFWSELYWDKGKRRGNEDSVSLQEVWLEGKKTVFAMVCDGIGGLAAGETASGFAAQQMTDWFYREALVMLKRKKGRRKIGKAGMRVLYECNAEMNRFAKMTGSQMGTTVTALLLYQEWYLLWHSGDTRLYRLTGTGRRKRMIRLTEDHAADGNTLIRCIGSFSWIPPDVKSGRVRKKTVFVICSDGFRNCICEERIGDAFWPEVVRSRENVRMVLKEIAGYVKRRGEKDNISAVVIKAE